MNGTPNQDLAELAPFYVAGTLAPDEKARFEAALAQDPELASNVAAARAERDEILALNEALPAPSAQAFDALQVSADTQTGSARLTFIPVPAILKSTDSIRWR